MIRIRPVPFWALVTVLVGSSTITCADPPLEYREWQARHPEPAPPHFVTPKIDVSNSTLRGKIIDFASVLNTMSQHWEVQFPDNKYDDEDGTSRIPRGSYDVTTILVEANDEALTFSKATHLWNQGSCGEHPCGHCGVRQCNCGGGDTAVHEDIKVVIPWRSLRWVIRDFRGVASLYELDDLTKDHCRFNLTLFAPRDGSETFVQTKEVTSCPQEAPFKNKEDVLFFLIPLSNGEQAYDFKKAWDEMIAIRALDSAAPQQQ